MLQNNSMFRNATIANNLNQQFNLEDIPQIVFVSPEEFDQQQLMEEFRTYQKKIDSTICPNIMTSLGGEEPSSQKKRP